MPEELNPGQVGGAEASPAAETPSSGVDAGQVGGGAAAPPASESEWTGVRDALLNYGIDLRQQFNDDDAALAHLATAYRNAQQNAQLVQYGQSYLQHAGEFQQYLQQRQEAARAEAAKQATSWWKAPEYDPRWESQLTRDPTTGELRAVSGADPSVVQKFLAWSDHQRGFLSKFSQDPITAIRPGIEQIARQVAAEMIQQNLGGYREQTAAAQFIEQNSSWLHARDGAGNVIQNPETGRPALSEWGQRFLGYVQEAERSGLRDVAGQQKYALGLVQRDYLLSQRGPAAAADAGAAAKDAFLNQAARHQPNEGQRAAGVPAVPGNGVPNNAALLRDLLAKNLQAGGFGPGTQVPTPAGGR